MFVLYLSGLDSVKMYTKEEAREKIKVLAENFEAKLDYIKNSGEYKEAQI